MPARAFRQSIARAGPLRARAGSPSLARASFHVATRALYALAYIRQEILAAGAGRFAGVGTSDRGPGAPPGRLGRMPLIWNRGGGAA